tara:strand:- start:6289 stop:7566 length:1278 start_codon:yes stop_codon:yes gene_type:complete
MKHSEIFENFIKIAEENGLMESDKAIAKLDKTRRHDYLSADDIEKLYNIKPDVPEGMKYERNIIEDAHPNSVVVSPSYDKINGLVENQNERQNIMLNIVNKPVNGQLTGHKYAHNELALNLIRLANDLDNKNNHELLNLADVCLNQIGTKSLKKQAIVPLLAPTTPVLIPTIIMATALAGLWMQQHMKFINEGYARNFKRLIEQLDKLIISEDKPLLFGYQYSPEFIIKMKEFKEKLEKLNVIVTKNIPAIDESEKFRTAKELIEFANTPEGANVANEYNNLRKEITNITPFITKMFNKFKSQDYKDRQIINKGTFSDLIDKTQILHGGNGLITDDFDDVNKALEPFKESLKAIFKALNDVDSRKESTIKELEQAKSSLSSEYGINLDSTAPTAPAAPAAPTDQVASKEKSIFDRLTELSKSYLG